ncbi:MAG TPA: hypothetical protein VJZ26_12685, partial [Blastocatellia bacterium]|nr:hypothetical protein [Blastocatellia bacterium]
VYFLQQPPDSIRAKRIWEICDEQGMRVGVYGSLCSWPPRKVDGFYVPDTFAPTAETYPAKAAAIQELNLTYTRSIRLPSDKDGLMFKARLGARLLGLGLGPATVARIARQLARERVSPEVRWQRVALQPLVNFDFFSRLYRKHRPEFATFHTNHVAHYMHTYWKAMQPDAFEEDATPDEVRVYGRAIEHGYRTADELLKRMLKLIDENTVLVIASSMGQKPFVSSVKGGKQVRQIRSLEKIIEILGVEGRAEALSTMSDQFNIYPDSTATRDFITSALKAAYVDTPDQPMFWVSTVENSITVNLLPYNTITEESRCHFPNLDKDSSMLYENLVYSTGMVKSGCHDPKGMMIMYGPGVRRGGFIPECNNLDIAPTLLSILGLGVPVEMSGRVLEEALTEAPQAALAY